MAGFSDYLEKKLLDHTFGGVAYTPPAAIYVALYSAAPSDTGGGTEVTTTIRTAGRPAATFGPAANVSTAMTTSNTAIVDFGASAGTATVTHFGLFDAASGGNFLGWNAVTTSLAITPNINVSFPIGSLVVTQD
jgi:hypothetical protein